MFQLFFTRRCRRDIQHFHGVLERKMPSLCLSSTSSSSLSHFELSERFDEVDLIPRQKKRHRWTVDGRGGARIVDNRLDHIESVTNLIVDEITTLTGVSAFRVTKIGLRGKKVSNGLVRRWAYFGRS